MNNDSNKKNETPRRTALIHLGSRASVTAESGCNFSKVNLYATTFDKANAAMCVAECASVYNDRPSVSCEATDTRALVVELPDCRIVAFRGSKSLKNWITDAQLWRRLLTEEANGDKVEVHHGFLDAYESIIADLTAYLRQPGDVRPLFITGHSLGGALAILAALELKRQGFPIAQVYTFGQPRVGNAAFKRLYEYSLGASTFRVVYQEDIVARIPHLPAFHDPYQHVGTEVFLPAFGFGDIIFNPSWLRLLISDACGLYRAWRAGSVPALLDDVLADHHINNYQNALSL